MKWFILTFILGLFLSQSVMAERLACTPAENYSKMGKKAVIHWSYSEASFSQAAVIFIQGPESSFQSSAEFIRSLCEKGFTVAAFDLIGKKLKPHDYLKAADLVMKWTKTSLAKTSASKTPLVVYGYSKGAQIAISLSMRHKGEFKRVLLESPVLTKIQMAKFGNSSIQERSRVFGCAYDKKFSARQFKRTAYFVPVLIAKSDVCTHHLTGSGEITFPMAEYIEGDFHSNGLWSL